MSTETFPADPKAPPPGERPYVPEPEPPPPPAEPVDFTCPGVVAEVAMVAASLDDCSPNAKKFGLQNVLVQVEDGVYTVTASNGRILASASGQASRSLSPLPTPPCDDGPGEAALIPASQLLAITREARSRRRSSEVRFRLGGKLAGISVRAGSTTSCYSIPTDGGRFPPYRDVTPKGEPALVVHLDLGLLADLARVAHRVAGVGARGRMELHLMPATPSASGVTPKPSYKVAIMACGDNDVEFYGLLMPLG